MSSEGQSDISVYRVRGNSFVNKKNPTRSADVPSELFPFLDSGVSGSTERVGQTLW